MPAYDQRYVCAAIFVCVIAGVMAVETVSQSLGFFRLSFEGKGKAREGEHGTSAPSVPISVRVFLSSLPPLNDVAELSCVVKTVFIASNVSVEVILPEGFVLVDGVLSWKGSLPEGGKTELKATIRAVKIGNWTIEARAGYPIGAGYYSDIARLYVSVSKNSASISPTPFSEATRPNATRTTRPP